MFALASPRSFFAVSLYCAASAWAKFCKVKNSKVKLWKTPSAYIYLSTGSRQVNWNVKHQTQSHCLIQRIIALQQEKCVWWFHGSFFRGFPFLNVYASKNAMECNAIWRKQLSHIAKMSFINVVVCGLHKYRWSLILGRKKFPGKYSVKEEYFIVHFDVQQHVIYWIPLEKQALKIQIIYSRCSKIDYECTSQRILGLWSFNIYRIQSPDIGFSMRFAWILQLYGKQHNNITCWKTRANTKKAFELMIT